MRRLLSLGASVLLFFNSCSRAPAPEPVKAADFRLLREIELETGDTDPQAAWSPTGDWIVARSGRGLVLLREGGRLPWRASGGVRPGWPAWLDDHRIIFGPEEPVVRDEEGRVRVPASGLQIATRELSGLRPEAREFGQGGWRPRPWKDGVMVSLEDKAYYYGAFGKGETYDSGFLPEPQADGPGFAIQTTPMIQPDYWTGSKELGQLLIRWNKGQTDLLRGGVQATWNPRGGMCFVQLDALPDMTANKPWWQQVPHRLLVIDSPGAAPRNLGEHLHDPAPHPCEPVLAAIDSTGALVLMDLAGGGEPRVLATQAARPLWHPSGRRLVYERRDAASGQVSLVVLIFHLPTQQCAER